MLQEVDDRGHRAGRQPGRTGQRAGRHAAGLVDEVGATRVGPVHAEVVRDRLVEVVVRRLIRAEQVAEFRDELLTT